MTHRDEVFQTLRDLGDVRDAVPDVYRRLGGSTTWSASDVDAMARAITEVEDELERSSRTRHAVRVARTAAPIGGCAMTLRKGHGNGAGVPRIEVLPADELPSPNPTRGTYRTACPPLTYRHRLPISAHPLVKPVGAEG